jgi:stearoyl-CoA desaturase (delta-9 desaturase)
MGWLLGPTLANSAVFARDLLHDRPIAFVNRTYVVWLIAGIVMPGVVESLATGRIDGLWRGMLWGGLIRMFVSFHATCSVNSLTHVFGRRPFAVPGDSTNLTVVALATFGEGWHNNHHAFPFSARIGLRWFEPDVGFAVIRALEVLGLAWDVKTARGGVPSADASHPAHLA